MKIKQNWIKLLILSVIIILICVAAYIFMPKILQFLGFVLGMFLPFIIGYFFSRMVNPLADFLQKKLKCPRGISAIIVIVFTIGIIGGILFAIIWKLVVELRNLYIQSPQIYSDLQGYWQNFVIKMSNVYNNMPQPVRDSLTRISEDFSSKIATFINNRSTPVVLYASDFAKGIPGGLITVIIFILSVYFMVVDSKNVSNTVHRMLSPHMLERVNRVKDECKHFIGGYIKAQFILMCINFVIMLVEFLIAGTNYAMLIALSTSFLDALPVFGSGIVLWPIAIVSFISGNIKNGVVMLIAYASVFISRRILEPKLVSSKIGINPLMTLMSMYIGYRIWGIGGIILGIIVMLVIISFYRSGLLDGLICSIKKVWKYITGQCKILKEFIIEQMEDNDE